MTVNHTPADIERMKKKAYNLFYKKHICRLITNQAMELQKLFCNKNKYDSFRLEEIEGYQKLLNKVWIALKEKEILIIQEMLDLNFSNLEIPSVMDYSESRYSDDYAIMEMYGIIKCNYEGNKRRINSLTQ